MVTYYWGLLANLGKVAPTAYDLTTSTPQPVPFPSTNNIFVNESLFRGYFDYKNIPLFPLIEEVFLASPPTPVLLNDETSLKSTQTTILRSYTCSWRRIRFPVPLIISVIVADYAMIEGANTVLQVISGWWQKRKDDRKVKK